ncbi:glycoside hydrolase family 99-like domain-containing protein [Hafnia alvei]|uniref:Glycosyltransferase WbsX n=1 Tax=Hafnia alvei TaxID=569 RepID=A0A172X091_HAFAL|nr:glycoside hydrolase family 99-like domain-containing protein [Hafnia alvei]ANF30040.1 hypothetical protein [Hafnia alvei]TBL64674.1 hypothetical protein EYY96_22200 [Hafnia alvei]
MKKIIAYYLPQFHEIEENNQWWGKGFTEWTALENARKYTRDQKIRKPTELGYYCLDNINVIEKQFSLASEHGISAFCLWTYWFGNGEKILEKPLELMLKHNNNIDYCIAWANHSWMNKSKGILLKEQKYLGGNDYKLFFEYMLPHFKKNNYIKNENKPVVTIFDPKSIPDLSDFINIWNSEAKKNGFDGVYFIGDYTRQDSPYVSLLSAYLDSSKMFINRTFAQKVIERLVRRHRMKIIGPVKYDYKKMISSLWSTNNNSDDKEIPVIYSGWDTTIRHGRLGVIFQDFTVENFNENVHNALTYNKCEYVFLKSWNEWAEGNVIEPDTVFGRELLRKIKDNLDASTRG